MKQYLEIQGPSKAPRLPCIAFYKYDGSNIRVEWSRKTGWSKFGSRHRLLDETDPELNQAIPTFMEQLAPDLEEIFRSDKRFREARVVTVFSEFFGPNSFAGRHLPDDPKEVVLIDVNIHKKGLMSPRDFVKTFNHIRSARVIYEGNFTNQFIRDIIAGEYPVVEGIVAKGTYPNKKAPHNIWMAKCKTAAWMERLKNLADEIPALRGILQDNEREQDYAGVLRV